MGLKKYLVTFLIPGLSCAVAQQQDVFSLTECHQLAIRAHPLHTQYETLENISKIQISRIESSRNPDLVWLSRARIQSDVVEFPLDLPGMNLPKLPLFGFQTGLESSWTILDGGLREALLTAESARLPTEIHSLSVELEKIKPQINELFFGILAQREKIEVLRIALSFLQTKWDVCRAAIQTGISTERDADNLKLEILRTQNSISEAQLENRAMLDALSTWIQIPLSDSSILLLPAEAAPTPTLLPQYSLFNAQKERLLASEALVHVGKNPRLSAWGQAGLGYPNPFNFFDNTLSPFAAAGMSLSWRITDWKQNQRDKEIISLQIQSLDAQLAAFDHQTRIKALQIERQLSELDNLEVRESEILEIQGRLLEQVEREWALGMATAMDVIEQSQAVTKAQLQLKNRMLQRRLLQASLWTILGKL